MAPLCTHQTRETIRISTQPSAPASLLLRAGCYSRWPRLAALLAHAGLVRGVPVLLAAAGSLALAAATCDPYAANCSSTMPCPWPLPASLCRAPPAGATLLLDTNLTVVCDGTCSAGACAATTAKEAVLRYQGLLRSAANSSAAAAFRSAHGGTLQKLSLVKICAHEHSDALPSTQDYSLDVSASGTATLLVGTIFGGIAGLESLLQLVDVSSGASTEGIPKPLPFMAVF